jgi:hypothetical protein
VIFGIPEGWVFGLPTPCGLIGLLALAASSIMLAQFLGFWHVYSNGRWEGYTFNHNIAAGVGVAFALMGVFSMLTLAEIAARNSLEVAQVVDSATLDYPNMFILGGGFGIIFSMFTGYLFGAKGTVLVALPLGIASTVLLASGHDTDIGASNAAAGITAVVLLTHLVWQPLYFAMGLITYLLAKMNPAWSRFLWRVSPASWSEFCYVPLVGLSSLVMALYQMDPAAGLQAVKWLKRHPFYRPIGKRLSNTITAMAQTPPGRDTAHSSEDVK